MIYIFQGCQSIFSLPGLCCKGCAELCRQINCKPLQECCQGCGAFVVHFFERPLSTFVIFAFVASPALLYSTYLALDEDKAEACDFSGPVDGTTYAGIQGLFALIFLVFGVYAQRAVWRQMMEDLKESPDTKVDDVPSKNPDAEQMVRIKKEVVFAAFKKVFLEDFFVLLIFVMLVGNTVLSGLVQTTAECTFPPEPYATSLPKVMLGCCTLYTLLYFCCTCCADKVTIEKKELDALTGQTALSQNDSLE